jgi:hypothetical protein
VEKAVFRWLYHLPPASSAVKEKVQEEAPPRLAMINYFTLGDGEIFVRKLFEVLNFCYCINNHRFFQKFHEF